MSSNSKSIESVITRAVNMALERIDRTSMCYFSLITRKSVRKCNRLSFRAGEGSKDFQDTDVIGFRFGRIRLLTDSSLRVPPSKTAICRGLQAAVPQRHVMLVRMLLGIQVYLKFCNLRPLGHSPFIVRATLSAVQKSTVKKFMSTLKKDGNIETTISGLIDSVTTEMLRTRKPMEFLLRLVFLFRGSYWIPYGASPSNIAYFLIIQNQMLLHSYVETITG